MSSGLLAGIGLTRLRVYDQRPAPDGTLSGCAHVHAYTDEAYYVIAGRGALELHDVEHGFRRVPPPVASAVLVPAPAPARTCAGKSWGRTSRPVTVTAQREQRFCSSRTLPGQR